MVEANCAGQYPGCAGSLWLSGLVALAVSANGAKVGCEVTPESAVSVTEGAAEPQADAVTVRPCAAETFPSESVAVTASWYCPPAMSATKLGDGTLVEESAAWLPGGRATSCQL